MGTATAQPKTEDYFARTSRYRANYICAPEFELGDIVYALTLYRRDATVDCKVCSGTGRVQVVGSDSMAYCPESGCRTGRKTVTKDQRFCSIRQLTIRRLVLQVTDTDPSDYPLRWVERDVSYMAAETGVGSGQVWPEDRLFWTPEAATDRAEEYGAVDDGGAYHREEQSARFGR